MSTLVREYFTHGEIGLWMLPNGHINCDECADQKPWCEHIRSAIKDHADSVAIWTSAQDSDPMKIEVPMFPTANLWTTAVLESAPKLDAFKVFFRRLDPQHDTFLGFLHRGEGRAIIRSMIFDWFEGQIDPRTLECKSASHKFKQEMDWQQSIKDPQRAIIQYWSVWCSNTCISCLIPDDWGPDLVPDGNSNNTQRVFR